jgi:hypothetical protein
LPSYSKYWSSSTTKKGYSGTVSEIFPLNIGNMFVVYVRRCS